jgi:hypothetical protein
MATEIFINIKDLPELSEINNGDYIVVETALGTKILDFQNLVLPSVNTLISTTVQQNAQVVTDLITNISTVTGAQDLQISTLNSTTSSLNSNLSSLSGKSFQMYVGYAQITIPSSSTTGSSNISPTPNIAVIASDIIITPANSYASKHNAYVTSVNNGLITLKGDFSTNIVTFDYTASPTLTGISDILTVMQTAKLSSVTAPASEDAIYNVFAIKKF